MADWLGDRHGSPSQPFTFPASYFTNGANRYFLFEGCGTNGNGELLLTITQNGTNVAQTGAWLDLHDVKDFYERMVITNNVSGGISNWTSGIETVQYASASALDDDKDLIVLVHGINVGVPDWLIESENRTQTAVLGRLSRQVCHREMAVQLPDATQTAYF